MDAEMKSPMTEKVVEKKVYEDDGKKHEYASKGVAGTALGLGIAGTALALMPALGGSRGLFGGLGSGYGYGGALPENVNINVDKNTNTYPAASNEPTALSVLEKENQDEVNLMQEMFNLKLGTERQFYNARNTDVAEKFSIWKGVMDGMTNTNERVNRDMFSLYKSQTDADFRLWNSQITGDFNVWKAMMDGDARLKDAMVQQGFGLYKNQRDSYDATQANLAALNEKYAAKFCELDKKVAVMEAIRPYQDKLLMSDMERYYERGINYADRKCCRKIDGQLVLANTPVVTGYGSYSGCNCAAASSTTGA